MKITLRDDLKLQTCGQKDNPNHLHSERSHELGCYIRFKEGKVEYTRSREDCIIDYDSEGKIIGIEFYDGLNDLEG